MRIILILSLLSLVTIPFRVRAFEALVGSLLLTPAVLFLIGSATSLSPLLCYATLISILLLWCFLRRGETPQEESLQGGFTPLYILAGTFLVIYSLCLQWPDFIAIGERFRDFALLSSVIQSPIDLKEPWMAGQQMNYYAYWYRLGHLLSSLFNLPTWDVYHQLQSLTFALYISAIYRVCERWLKLSWSSSLFVALFTALCSNVQGVFSYLQSENGWWGPSRVIPGAINEFPLWSFLLGDLHPHYLNLAAIPLSMLFLLNFYDSAKSTGAKLGVFVCFAVLPALWIYNGNAWEVPVWGLFFGALFTLYLLAPLFNSPQGALIAKGFTLKNCFNPAYFTALAFTGVLGYSLYLSSRNIIPAEFPWSLVRDPIPGSQLLDLLRHWGFPLTLYCVSLCFLLPWQIVTSALILCAFSLLITPNASPILLIILALLIIRIVLILRSRSEPLALPRAAIEAIAIVGIIVLLIPEFVFLNDPYGGENERMNTIFKLYASNWFFMHLAGFWLLREALYARGPVPQIRTWAVQFSIILVFSAFFFRTVPMRRSQDVIVQPKERGLSQVEREFPGSAEVIKALHAAPAGLVLEAQGNPYSYTSFVSTLAEKTAYLGWANHVNLLTRQYGEVTRREKLTESVYNEASCAGKLSLLKQEGIRYIVLGSLERKKYAGGLRDDFGCLKTLAADKEYKIFEVP